MIPLLIDLLWGEFGIGPLSLMRAQVPPRWVQVFYAAVQKPRTAEVDGRCPERVGEDASDAWKEKWERQEEPPQELGVS